MEKYVSLNELINITEQNGYLAIDDLLNTESIEIEKNGCWELWGNGNRFATCSNCGTIFDVVPSEIAFVSNNKYCRLCCAKIVDVR